MLNLNEVKSLVEAHQEGEDVSNVFNFIESDLYLIKNGEGKIIAYDPFDEQILFNGSIDDWKTEHHIDIDFEDDEDGCMEELREFLG